MINPLPGLKDFALLRIDDLINGQWVKGGNRFDVNAPLNDRKTGHRGQPRPGQ